MGIGGALGIAGHRVVPSSTFRPRHLCLTLLALLVGLCATANAASAQTWQLARDWATSPDNGTTAPSSSTFGAWTVGYGTSSYTNNDPTLTSFTAAAPSDWSYNQQGSALQGWSSGGPGGYPYMAKNTSDANAFGIWPVGAVDTHPAPDTGNPSRGAVEWTSPVTGTISIAASFKSMNPCSDGVDYSVDFQPAGGALRHVSGDTIAALHTGVYSTAAVQVSAGDSYYFSVGDGGNGSFTCDSTEINVTISDGGGTGGKLAWENDITGIPQTSAHAATTLKAPEGVALSSGNVLIADSGNNRLLEITPYGNPLDGNPNGGVYDGVTLNDPRQAVASDGYLVAADTFDHQVARIGEGDGNSYGTEPLSGGSWGAPRGIAAQSDGSHFAVADASNNAVYLFDSSWNLLKTLTASSDAIGAVNAPEGVAFDSAGNIWVADTQNHRIVEFAPDGSVLNHFGGPGTPFYPTGIAVDPTSGNLWVADWMNSDVVELSKTDGSVITTITDASGTSDPLKGPVTVAVDPSTGDVYVADSGNSRIVHYTQPPSPPVVTTDGLYSIDTTSLGVQGHVNPSGAPTRFYFRYGEGSDPAQMTDAALSSHQPDPSLSAGSNTSSQRQWFLLSGLKPNTSYCFQLVAVNAGGTSMGKILCHSTVAAPPAISTNVGYGTYLQDQTDLGVEGGVNPEGSPTTYYFQYGPGSDPSQMTDSTMPNQAPNPAASAGSDWSDHTEQQTLNGLQPGTSYCFQLVAKNAVGTSRGPVVCHGTTAAATPVPILATSTPCVSVGCPGESDVGIDSITMRGSVNPDGAPTSWYFQITRCQNFNFSQCPAADQTTTNVPALSSGQPNWQHLDADSSAHIVSETASHLNAGTTYYWRLVGKNENTGQTVLDNAHIASAKTQLAAGGAWSAPAPFTEPYENFVTGAGGDRVSVWRTCSDSSNSCTIYVARQSPGGSWSNPQTVGTGSTIDDVPRVAVDGQGNATIIWNQIAPHSNDGPFEAVELDNNGVLGSPQQLSPSAGTYYAITALPSGKFVVAWSADTSSVTSATAPSAGGTFASSGTIPFTDAIGNQLTLTTDGLGHATAIATIGDVFTASQSVLESSTQDDSGNWGAAQTIPGSAASGPHGGAVHLNPGIAEDPAGDIAAVWTIPTLNSDDSVLFAERKAGGSWTTATKLTSPGAAGYSPSIAMNSRGELAVSWLTGLQSGPQWSSIEAVIRQPGGSFSSPVQVNSGANPIPGGNSLWLNDKGEATVEWHEGTSWPGNEVSSTLHPIDCGAPTVTAQYDSPAVVRVTCATTSGDSVASLNLGAAPQHGQLGSFASTGTAGYTPTDGYVGSDSLTATATDANGAVSVPVTVGITVLPPEHLSATTLANDLRLPAANGSVQTLKLQTGVVQVPLGKIRCPVVCGKVTTTLSSSAGQVGISMQKLGGGQTHPLAVLLSSSARTALVKSKRMTVQLAVTDVASGVRSSVTRTIVLLAPH